MQITLKLRDPHGCEKCLSGENVAKKRSLLRKGSQAHTMWQHSKLRQTERSPHGMQYFQATPQPVPSRKSNLPQNLESAQRTPTLLGSATNGRESLQICCTNLCYSCCYLFESLSTSMSLVQLQVQEVQLPHWTDMLPKISVMGTLRQINGCRSIASCILKTLGTTLAYLNSAMQHHGTKIEAWSGSLLELCQTGTQTEHYQPLLLYSIESIDLQFRYKSNRPNACPKSS